MEKKPTEITVESLEQFNLQIIAENKDLKAMYAEFLKKKIALDTLRTKAAYDQLKEAMNTVKPEPRKLSREEF